MTDTVRKSALCLMAHPDDCEMLSAGTMLLLKERGWEIHIVTMTPGDCGSVELGREEIAAVRREESRRAAALVGASFHCVESPDAFVTYDEATLRRTVEIVRPLAPSIIITHALDDYHMDHEVTARIARQVSFAYAVPNAAPGPVVEGSRIPWLYYAYVSGGLDPYGNPVRMSTYVNVTTMMEQKTEMLKCHASQRDWLRKHHGMDHYVDNMRRRTATQGEKIGVPFAESYRQHLGHPYPQDCILSRELGAELVTKV
jgi:LmbE family N-acetylglucosaminyl deacetylase